MSRKHFQAVADGLLYSAGNLVRHGEMSIAEYKNIINSVAYQIACVSSRFDSDRFMAACLGDLED